MQFQQLKSQIVSIYLKMYISFLLFLSVYVNKAGLEKKKSRLSNRFSSFGASLFSL